MINTYLYINDGNATEVDISSYIVNDFVIQNRVDNAFAISSMKIIIPANLYSGCEKNIPPFTFIKINNNFYVCKSTCSKYMRKNNNSYYYSHDIEIMELNALLEGYNLGTKAFSFKSDEFILDTICRLMSAKYDVSITFSNTANINLTTLRTKTYPNGTTMHYALNDIASVNKARVRTEVINANTSTLYSSLELRVSLQDLTSYSSVFLNPEYFTNIKYLQDTDNYCKHLESECNNVVDRDTYTSAKYLTVRSDNQALDSSSCFIEMPSAIESFKRLEVFTTINATILIRCVPQSSNGFAKYLYQAFAGLSFTMNQLCNLTLWEGFINDGWVETGLQYETAQDIVDIFTTFRDGLINAGYSQNIRFEIGSYSNGTFYNNGTGEYIGFQNSNVDQWVDITPRVIEKAQYNLLTAPQKVEYCFYESGSNKIEGMYNWWHSDWYYQLFGLEKKPMLSYALDDYDTVIDSGVMGIITVHGSNTFKCVANADAVNLNPVNVYFNAEYYPISSMFMNSEKNDTPINEHSYKNLSTTYNNSAERVDFNLLSEKIAKTNESYTPRIEITCKPNILESQPSGSRFYYDYKYWYIIAKNIKYSNSGFVVSFQACQSYDASSKAIGVETQFQSTKIDLTTHIDRHIYFTSNNSITIDRTKLYLLRCRLYDSQNILHESFLRVDNFYNTNKGLILVAKFKDNVSAGSYMEAADSIFEKWAMKDLTYTDNYGEAVSMQVRLMEYSSITLAESRLLPNAPNTTPNVIWTSDTINIYKDQIERLIITIDLPNGNIS